MRLAGQWPKVPVVLAVLMLSVALVAPAAVGAAPGAARVRLSADLACLPAGGANVTFTVRNVGRQTVELDGDFHLFLDRVTRSGRELVQAVFVFPAPGFDVIDPGESSTFLIGIGEPFEGEPGADLSGRRLLLEAEVFLVGQEKPVTREFTFRACKAPVATAV